MDASRRRDWMYQTLIGASAPLSASALAAQAGVSRQVIVGDIALLRAQGHDIIATARGYTMARPRASACYIGKLACQHGPMEAERELQTIVEHGGEVLDVIVEHAVYGEISGQLGIATAGDIQDFMQKVRSGDARLLSGLTDGVHLHTVACKDRKAFEAIQRSLSRHGLLYRADQ